MAKGLKIKILELRKKGFSYNEIKNILNCSKSTISHYCGELKISNKTDKLTKQEIENLQLLYEEHKSLKTVSVTSGRSLNCVKKYVKKRYGKNRKFNKTQSVIKWRKRTKQKLIDLKGGSCERCGYNKCINALQFHHRDPNQKDFNIGSKCWSYDRLKLEVEKCALLCSNCHIETHSLLNDINVETKSPYILKDMPSSY